MIKPKILVSSAAGHTGSTVVLQLLEKGFPVRAFVRRSDVRSQYLENAGAEVFVGNLFDFRDLRKALAGVQRAYHCPPFAANILHGSMLFALAAEEAKLEVVALMSAWNPHPVHPSIATRELWLEQNIYRWMPTVDVIHINPGLFAFTYFFGLSAAIHFGMLMLPYGEGLNAPPSNEDIGAVAAGVLASPSKHIGKSFRPTGPRLISGHDCAQAFSRVLSRRVRYVDVSTRMFTKAAKAQGFSSFEIAQMRHYAEELRSGAYAVGAPTDHVEKVCGRPAENFYIIARRYLQHPELVMPGLRAGSKLSTFRLLLKTILTSAPDLDLWTRDQNHPIIGEPLLAQDSIEWLASAKRQQANLLLPDSGDKSNLKVESSIVA